MTSLSYDPKGNLTEDHEGKDYTWDAHNMLTSVTVPMGASGIEGTHTYAYDALGRRVSKTVLSGTMSAETTVFVCRTEPILHSSNAGQELAEYTSATGASSPLRKYVFGSYIDEPVALIDRTALGSTGAGSDELIYYHRSRLYSVVALSDFGGDIIERATYTPYGETLPLDASATTPQTASAVASPWGFTGRRSDEESGLAHFRARTIDTTLGRFLSRDPIGYEAGPQLYTAFFAPNDVDPSGYEQGWQWFVPRPKPVIKPAGPVTGLAAHIIATCCANTCGVHQAICSAEAQALEDGLERARQRINRTGGVTRFDYAGNVCTECVAACQIETSGPPGIFCDIRDVANLPWIDTPFWGGHQWSEIYCPYSGTIVATVDFWGSSGNSALCSSNE
jgi:RHS repeat-associated protein